MDPQGQAPGAQRRIGPWRAIRRRLRRILGLAVAAGVLAALISGFLPPLYESSATLVVEPPRGGAGALGEGRDSGWLSARPPETWLKTQVLSIESRSLAVRVADRLGLWIHPELDPRRTKGQAWPIPPWVEDRLPADWVAALAPPPMAEAQARRAVVESLVGSVRALPIPDSQVLRISYRSADPQLAARVATAYGEAAIELGLESRLAAVEKVATWLAGRLKGLRERLEASELKLQGFRDAQGWADSEGTPERIEQELARLAERLAEARAKAEALGAEHQQVSRLADPGADRSAAQPAMLRSPLLQSLKAEESRIEAEVSELAKRYGEQHPKMLAARAGLESARARLQGEIDNAVAGVRKEREIAQALVEQLGQDVERLKGRVEEARHRSLELRALERDAQADRQLYDLFLARFEEGGLGSELDSAGARILDQAEVPERPIRPRRGPIAGAAALVALLLGIALALREARSDIRLKSAAEVESSTGLPVLGTVPLLRGRARRFPERAYLEHPKSDFAEAIRTLRTGVLLALQDRPGGVLLVASAIPGEGKTSVAINLALALSQVERVLLVDTDLRRAAVGTKLGLPADGPGVAALACGQATLDECIRRVPGTGLDCLPAGPLPPNPLELLSSPGLAQALDGLKGRYDRILLDSAPAQAVSDALALSRLAGAVLLVVQAGAAPAPLVELAVRRLRRAEAPLIGAVLSHFDSARAASAGDPDALSGRRFSYAYHGYTRYGRDSGPA
jgi:capsular exopolysaccharide synthesis family protein